MDIPQWLSQTYVRSVQAAGSTLPKEKLAEACRDLVTRWSSPERRYHNVQHLIDTLTRIETLLPSTHSPHLVQLAAWYHGLVFSVDMKDIYTRNGGEDEFASARVAEEELTALGVEEDKAHRVAQLIRSLRARDSEASSRTTAKFQAIDVDALVLHDAHLGCLCVEPQRYRTYVSQVRDEYAEVSDIGFCSARYEIVSNLLHRRPLFITPLAHDWEERARANLESERERLTKRLKELEMFATLDSRLSSTAVPARVPVPDYIDGTRSEASEKSVASGRSTAPLPPPENSGEETAQFTAITPDTSVETAASPEQARTTGEFSTGEITQSQSQTKTQSQAKAREKARFSVKTSEMPRSRKESFSSLEDISERIETEKISPKVNKTLSDEKKKRRREEIAEQMRLRMSQREQATSSSPIPARSEGSEQACLLETAATKQSEDATRLNIASLPEEGEAISSSNTALQEPEIASPETVPSASTPDVAASTPSAETPEDMPSYGMEREPND